MTAELAAPFSLRSFLFTARVAAALGVLLPLLWLRLKFTRGEIDRFIQARLCARRVLRLAGCQVSVTGAVGTDAGPVAMFVSNHASLADAAVLLAWMPADIRFVANHVFARYPLLGAAIRASSAHIVDRTSWRSRGECGRTMVTALREGQSLLVFPEGTTSPDGRLLPFRNGAFRAAVECAVPIVPIVLHRTRELLPPDSIWLHNVAMRIDILDPIHPEGHTRAAIADLKHRTIAAIEQAR